MRGYETYFAADDEPTPPPKQTASTAIPIVSPTGEDGAYVSLSLLVIAKPET